MCVPEACDVRVTVATVLKEKLALNLLDVVDAAVWNPRHRAGAHADEFGESVGRPRACGSRRGGARPKSSVCLQQVFATCPLRRCTKRSWTALTFRLQEKIPTEGE